MKARFDGVDFGTHILAIIQLFALLGSKAEIIPSKVQIHRQNTYHTCVSNEECTARMNSTWPQYKFVCCTTVVCDENYGNYYLVRSGCAPERQCAPSILIREKTKFAGTIFFSNFRTYCFFCVVRQVTAAPTITRSEYFFYFFFESNSFTSH